MDSPDDTPDEPRLDDEVATAGAEAGELSPAALENARFSTVADGFDPDEVRALLARVAERLRVLESGAIRGIGHSVEAVLEQAVKSAEELFDQARTEVATLRAEAEEAAAALREEAFREAEEITDAAGEIAASRIAEGERLAAETIEAAERRAREMLLDADRAARDHANEVLGAAQRRLDRLLAAERDVHDRLSAALADIHASIARVGVDQQAELVLTTEEPDLPAVDVDSAPWAGSGTDEGGDDAESASVPVDGTESDETAGNVTETEFPRNPAA